MGSALGDGTGDRSDFEEEEDGEGGHRIAPRGQFCGPSGQQGATEQPGSPEGQGPTDGLPVLQPRSQGPTVGERLPSEGWEKTRPRPNKTAVKRRRIASNYGSN